MNSGDVSLAIGLPAKTIRDYEDISLVPPARGADGYRDCSEQDAHKLAFFGRARSLGYTIPDCRTLLSFCEDRDGTSADAKALASEHLDRIAQKVEALPRRPPTQSLTILQDVSPYPRDARK